MPLWRRIAIAGVLVFIVTVAIGAFRPWTSAVSLPVVDNRTPQAVFRCGPPFGGDSVHPTNKGARSGDPLPHQPCTTRSARRALAIADLGVGGVSLVILIAVKRPQPVEDAHEHEKH